MFLVKQSRVGKSVRVIFLIKNLLIFFNRQVSFKMSANDFAELG